MPGRIITSYQQTYEAVPGLKPNAADVQKLVFGEGATHAPTNNHTGATAQPGSFSTHGMPSRRSVVGRNDTVLEVRADNQTDAAVEQKQRQTESAAQQKQAQQQQAARAVPKPGQAKRLDDPRPSSSPLPKPTGPAIPGPGPGR